MEAFKTAFVSGLGIGLGVGVVLLVARMVSEFMQGIFFDNDDDKAKPER